MTPTIRVRVSILARISAWVRRHQHELSARIHAAADEQARQHGWTVTETPGRFGFQTRSYRDPRFDDRRRHLERSWPANRKATVPCIPETPSD